ncbi:MAG TPA: alpha/beta fold hydrolase [Candidatus Limnocylindria bacterium]|jgi:dipeptidyl aminopeptidase/acylaminoacyl peptidase|nr:alpha/beta fold hydrolase [Candidatus Limnocylindria bacterium]
MATSPGRRRGVLGWVGRIAAAVTFGYLGYLTVEGSRRIVSPGRRPFLPEEGDPATPADIGLAYEDVRFTTDDGVTLSGWLVPAARETRAAVVLMHGFSWHRLPWLAGFVPWLQKRYHVLQFDFRGHGGSDDALISLGTLEQRDVAAAVRFLEGRGLGPIALMGISMGGSVAIMAAPDLPVAAVVADAAYAELRDPIANRMREVGYPLARLGAGLVLAAASARARVWLRSPLHRVAQISPRGLLLISPGEDRLVSPHQSQRMFLAAGEPKELFVVPGAAHAEAHLTAPEAYERRVLDFLARHLDGEAPV